jgi:hypothetical protein
MNKTFGKSWSCLTGNNVDISGVNVESNENTFIWFSFRGKHFIVFKQPLMEKAAEVNIIAHNKEYVTIALMIAHLLLLS